MEIYDATTFIGGIQIQRFVVHHFSPDAPQQWPLIITLLLDRLLVHYAMYRDMFGAP